MRADPALRGACDLFGAHRLGLRQQPGVAAHSSRTGSGDRVNQTSGVGLRHVTGLHRVTQSRHFVQRCGCGDLAASLPLRQARRRCQDLGAAVAVAFPSGDLFSGCGLRGANCGCDRAGRGQHPTQFGGGRGAGVDCGQQGSGGCFGSSGGFQYHEQ